jgi:predicted esterase
VDLAISGGMPDRFEPNGASALPPIRAIHGTRDEVIDSSSNHEGIDHLDPEAHTRPTLPWKARRIG